MFLHICKKVTYIKQTHYSSTPQIHQQKQTKINQYADSAFQPLLQFRGKTKKERGQSHFVLSSPSEGFLPSL